MQTESNIACPAGWVRCAAFVFMLGVVTMAQSPADRFVEALKNNQAIEPTARALIEKTWTECEDCDGEEFLTQGLAVVSEAFRAGLGAYEADEYDRCASMMSELRKDDDHFVAAHAAAYEIKVLVAQDRLHQAFQRIEELLGDHPLSESTITTHTYFAPEIAFLRGYCLLSELKFDEAGRALSAFREDYPDASQRLSIAADQMLAELATRQEEGIGEVVDLMNFSGRRLAVADASDDVQTKQRRIVELLDVMIEEAEKKENSSSSSKSSGGGGGSQGVPSPSNPMQKSTLPGGSGKEGSLRERRRANPGEMWGAMPPGERARILQALRDTFPSRYRQLVEQYYEELAKKP